MPCASEFAGFGAFHAAGRGFGGAQPTVHPLVDASDAVAVCPGCRRSAAASASGSAALLTWPLLWCTLFYVASRRVLDRVKRAVAWMPRRHPFVPEPVEPVSPVLPPGAVVPLGGVEPGVWIF